MRLRGLRVSPLPGTTTAAALRLRPTLLAHFPPLSADDANDMIGDGRGDSRFAVVDRKQSLSRIEIGMLAKDEASRVTVHDDAKIAACRVCAVRLCALSTPHPSA
jgi:hypothetical protein